MWYTSISNRGPNFEDLHTHLLKDMHAMKALQCFQVNLICMQTLQEDISEKKLAFRFRENNHSRNYDCCTLV